MKIFKLVFCLLYRCLLTVISLYSTCGDNLGFNLRRNQNYFRLPSRHYKIELSNLQKLHNNIKINFYTKVFGSFGTLSSLEAKISAHMLKNSYGSNNCHLAR